MARLGYEEFFSSEHLNLRDSIAFSFHSRLSQMSIFRLCFSTTTSPTPVSRLSFPIFCLPYSLIPILRPYPFSHTPPPKSIYIGVFPFIRQTLLRMGEEKTRGGNHINSSSIIHASLFQKHSTSSSIPSSSYPHMPMLTQPTPSQPCTDRQSSRSVRSYSDKSD